MEVMFVYGSSVFLLQLQDPQLINARPGYSCFENYYVSIDRCVIVPLYLCQWFDYAFCNFIWIIEIRYRWLQNIIYLMKWNYLEQKIIMSCSTVYRAFGAVGKLVKLK